MINLNLWLAFVGASSVIGLIPGPGVMSIIGYAINSGRNTALAAVAGMAVGNTIAMSLSMVGIGALLATSATAFSIIKWVGALYLIGLGLLTILRSKAASQSDIARPSISAKSAFLNNILVGTFHPKTIVFFVAFVPQFTDATRNYWTQSIVLLTTFVITVAITDTIYALVASRAAHLLRSKNGAFWSRVSSGTFMIVAGTLAACSRE